MVNQKRRFRRLLYRPRRGDAPFGDSGPALVRGRETRGMRANNKNSHPRSEAR
jgi:hypothetical protein